MTYLLYMMRSFTRSPRRHAVLFAVADLRVSAAAADLHLPGQQCMGHAAISPARSAGETYHIGNATEVDVPYFEGIRGLSAPVYRDGTIYLHILSDEEWRNAGERDRF